MKKYGIGVLILLVVIGVLFFIFKNEQANTVTQEVEDVSVEGVAVAPDKEPFSGIGTLESLRLNEKSLECQIVFEQGGAEGNVEGTFFSSKGNIRGDFMVPAPEFDGKVLSSMIVGGSSLYVWTTIEGATFGFKSPVVSADAGAIDTKEPVPMNETVKYTCTEWTEVDGSVFVPPADVEFTDVGAAVKAGMEYGTLE